MTRGLFDVGGKSVLITGGVNGMGRMIAEAFLDTGAEVTITSRKAADCEAADAELAGRGKVRAMHADLSTAEGLADFCDRFKAGTDRLDIIVNNAGRTWGAPLESFPAKAWAPVMTVNVQAPFTLVQQLLPLLVRGPEEDPARVINIGSAAGVKAEKLDAYSYAASKAAIHHLSRVMAADLADSGITVNAIVPGYFPTQMTSHIRADEAELDGLTARIPLKRLGRPDDIAGLCIFLSSPAGSYVTGTNIPVDGGLCGCG